jgi:hypothetical protein
MSFYDDPEAVATFERWKEDKRETQNQKDEERAEQRWWEEKDKEGTQQ